MNRHPQRRGKAEAESVRPWMRWALIAALFMVWPAAAVTAAPGTDVPDAVIVDRDDVEGTTDAARQARHVIHISVDGLRSDAVTRATSKRVPNLYRFRTEGAYTDNARTDYDYSNTLPNHTSQLTGRRVTGLQGHNWTKNTDPSPGETLHSNKGAYVASVFDVAHDNGLSTALYTSKSKFVIYDQSYNEKNGAEDVIGVDNGRDKIDHFVFDSETESLVDRFVAAMSDNPVDYAFVHLRDPDSAGHSRSWEVRRGSSYMDAVQKVDRLIGHIFEMVESTPELAGNTVIILTADHGGGGNWHNHGSADHAENYTIPFYVWGAGVEATELYALNSGTRSHPGMDNPGYDAPLQPIRNADAANLSLSHLGLPAVPGSSVNIAMDLTSGTMPVSRFELADASEVSGNDEGLERRAVGAGGGR